MSRRWKRAAGGTLAVVVMALMAWAAFIRIPARAPVEVAFLGYTNSASGALAALLEIRNAGKERIARNSCRISPEPADAGYWYAADVPSRRLDADESERLFVNFQPRPMSRWRATINYVRNPTSLEFRLMSTVDWLSGHGWAPAALRQWRARLSGGQVSTDWIVVPSTNGAPNKSVETNRRPTSPLIAGRQFGRAVHAPRSLSAEVAHLCR
jgi:hypothetical protein